MTTLLTGFSPWSMPQTNPPAYSRWWFSAQGSSAGTLEQQSILVDGKPVSGVYEVLHSVITLLQHSDFHRQNVRVYVQEGLGQVRPYVHYQTVVKRLARTKPVSRVKQQIAGLKKR